MNIIKSFFLIFSVALLLGCDKSALTIKRINGTYEIKKLKILDYAGITHETEVQGTITFTADDLKSKTGKYHFDFLYSSDFLADTLLLTGNYSQENQRDFDFYLPQNDPFKGTMVYYNKEDLQFEIPNLEYKGYYFILKKKK